MNKKLERYYDYIVNDLLDNTIIDNEGGFYRFPFPIGNRIKYNMSVMDLKKHYVESGTNSHLFSNFYVYLDTMYGIKPEEVKLLWDRYINRVVS